MPMKIFLLSKLKLAKENRISRADEKIEPVFQQVGGFLQKSFLHRSRILRPIFNYER